MGTEETGAKYETLVERTGVLVKVPKVQCPHFQLISAHTFVNGDGQDVAVQEHWKHGLVIDEDVGETKPIVNRHFYGLAAEDLGRRISATVKVGEKTYPDGRRFVFMDITKTADVTPIREVKVEFGFPPQEGDIPVSKLRVLRFVARPVREEKIQKEE